MISDGNREIRQATEIGNTHVVVASLPSSQFMCMVVFKCSNFQFFNSTNNNL